MKLKKIDLKSNKNKIIFFFDRNTNTVSDFNNKIIYCC